MKTPGFNAEKSLYRTGGHYRIGSSKAWSDSHADRHVLQQACFINGIETDCSEAFACLESGACVLVSVTMWPEVPVP